MQFVTLGDVWGAYVLGPNGSDFGRTVGVVEVELEHGTTKICAKSPRWVC